MSSQPNNVRITWFLRRVALHAWTRAHTWTQVRCVKTTRWTAASVLQVSDVCVRVYGPFFDVLWRSFEALRLEFVCVCGCRDRVRWYFLEGMHRSVRMQVQTRQNLQRRRGLPTGHKGVVCEKGPYFFFYDVTTYLYLVVGPLWCLFC